MDNWYGRAALKKQARSLAEVMLEMETDFHVKGKFAFNLRAASIVFVDAMPWDDKAAGRRWRDEDCTMLVRYLEMTHGPVFSWDLTYKAVQAIAARAAFDPVLVHLESLTWDGKYRLSSWLSRCLGAADTTWTRAVGRAWMISAVARTYQPGCQADHTLVLEGEQGAGKSTALRILGGEYFSDDMPDLHSKDAVMTAANAWIMELAELAAARRSDQESIKAFLTRRVDKFRPPHGRSIVEWPRRVVFAASTNDEHWIADDSGGRRYWPVRVGEKRAADLDLLTRSRDQLWAEAVAAFKGGEKWALFDRALIDEAKEQQDRRRMADPWASRLRQKLDGRPHITVPEAMEAIGLDIAKSSRGDAVRVGKALAALRWTRKRLSPSADRDRPWAYFPPPPDREEGAGAD